MKASSGSHWPAFCAWPPPHGRQKGWQTLSGGLKSPDTDMRCSRPAQGLSKLGSEAAEAVPALTAALKDKSPFVRRNIAQALGKIGPQAKSAPAP